MVSYLQVDTIFETFHEVFVKRLKTQEVKFSI